MSFAEYFRIAPEQRNRLGGLKPQAWVCLGPGFAREEFKALLLSEGLGFTAESVVGLQDLAVRIAALGHSELSADRVPGPSARQEILRMLLAIPQISSQMPELKRLRRQSTFFKKLERAVQSGRMSFAHSDEGQVYSERLAEKLGASILRTEVEALARAYEAWMRELKLWDLPLLLNDALEVLASTEPGALGLPEEILYFAAQQPESLELEFWSRLSQHVKVTRQGPLQDEVSSSVAQEFSETEEELETPETKFEWQRWHTLDDAAEELATRLSEMESWDGQVVLIPDLPGVRRAVRRAMEQRGIPLTDPRDPVRLRSDESVKWAMRPLELVARNFERAKVLSWLTPYVGTPLGQAWILEVQSRGIRNGLASYAGGALEGLHSRLKELGDALGGKKLCSEMSSSHLSYLREEVGDDLHKAWLPTFFEAIWNELEADMARIGQAHRRAHPLYWLERLQLRLDDASPPVDRLKPAEGVTLSRLGQAPLTSIQGLWVLGFPPAWLNGDALGDYWFSAREREILAAEFAVRSTQGVGRERKAGLQAWLKAAKQIHFLDAHYDWDGRERESILPGLRELVTGLKIDLPPEPVECGAHSRWLPSYGALRPLPAQSFSLPRLSTFRAPEIRATELDRYSRCAFMGLASGRWKLWDLREPEAELWPDVKGNLLHAAVRILIESRDDQGHFAKLPTQALNEAWLKTRPKGLLRGERIEQYARSKLVPVLEAFCEKEREYVQRAGTRVLSLEGPKLKLEFPGFSVSGIPDRIDEHPEGLLVIDYKSSSALPKGSEMLDQGSWLQLPFYALAAQKHFGKPAIGVQFVELNRKAGRGSGIFFKQFNGKEPGNLTQARSNSKSLVSIEPSDAWDTIESHVTHHAENYFAGKFEARPKDPTECKTCFYADLCGFRRKIADSVDNAGADGAPAADGSGDTGVAAAAPIAQGAALQAVSSDPSVSHE